MELPEAVVQIRGVPELLFLLLSQELRFRLVRLVILKLLLNETPHISQQLGTDMESLPPLLKVSVTRSSSKYRLTDTRILQRFNGAILVRERC